MFTWKRFKTNVRNDGRIWEVMSNLRSTVIPSLLELRCLISCSCFCYRITNFEQHVLSNLRVPWSLDISRRHAHMQVYNISFYYLRVKKPSNIKQNIKQSNASILELICELTSCFSGTRPPTPRKLGLLYIDSFFLLAKLLIKHNLLILVLAK